MKITVNGKELTIDIISDVFTIANLLDYLKINSARIVVEKNGVIADHINFNKEEVFDGDVIEIVQFVGGG